ncbi:MAG: hypothetical protein LBJ48_04795 [Coriobacteriales bacterium]|jgi:hypothetical protein|nr:hypothetical protein [Coriobacteriales bacterium]
MKRNYSEPPLLPRAAKRRRSRALLAVLAILAAGLVVLIGWTLLLPAEELSTEEAQQQLQAVAPVEEDTLGTEAGAAVNTEVNEGVGATAAADATGTGSGTASPALPLGLESLRQSGEYRRAETLESWRLLSDASCADYALAVLEDVHRQGYELVQAGFMDLKGESWGCVLTGSNGESLSVMLMPQHPFSPRSDANLLAVNILHYLEPEGLT